MILEFHDQFGNATRVSATRLAVCDDFGQPLLVALQHGPRSVIVHKAEPGHTEEFERALRLFGLTQTAIVSAMDLQPGDVRIG